MSTRYATKSRLDREGEVTPDEDEILTPEEAAAVLKVHPVTMFVWARENRGPPALKPAGVRLRRYSRNTILNWLRG
jgi:Helix-turn-helix domain